MGLCEEEARRLNEVFFYYITTARPFVTLKLAMTLDGKIATHSGASKWITGESSRLKAHRLRYESDAILVGVNTVLQDDPSLDVRWKKSNSITKVILDTRLKTPPDARLFRSGDRVIVFHGSGADENREELLRKNATLIPVASCDEGVELGPVFEELGTLSISSVLIEGGSSVAASAVRGGHVRKLAFFYGPKFIGGTGLSSVGDLGIMSLGESPILSELRLRRVGNDFLVQGYLER
jgi:diaminohydroxyphosphoribosylaminopyrimidine deaminase/5-amino-6-(5-phosphoribosylamino)uracil reductase